MFLILAGAIPVLADGSRSAEKKESKQTKSTAARDKPTAQKPVSFMREVAPILVRNCIACHNPKKNESKYVMTTFAQLAKGGKQGEGITLVPGEPDDCYFLDVVLPDAEPRMPYKLDPLSDGEIALLRRWIAEGAKYDGTSPSEDWTFLLKKTQVVSIPEAYPVTVPITALAFSPGGQQVAASGYHEITLWKTADGALARRVPGLSERIYGIAYSRDGKWLATASGDPGQYGLARLWTADPAGGGKPVRDLAEGQDVIFAVAFSPDGKRLATAGADRVVRVHETETGKLL
ncbi:MAG: c-type cytochrome domain-containing protein, partial [Isosphaeraceae bacterium]